MVAVCVTYQPDRGRLGQVLSAIAPQVAELHVLDNSETPAARDAVAECARSAGGRYLGLGGNLGLAAAYNRGIERARAVAATHVLLLDQDSVCGTDMVTQLLRAQQIAEATLEQPVFTAGPGYVDELSGRRSAVLRTGRLTMERAPRAPLPWQQTDMLISSGSLVPLAVFDRLGGFDEGLFIDHIDTDWALRVRHAGGVLLVVHTAAMRHRLGERVQRLWWRHWRVLPVHQSRRLYYIYRNSLLLWRRPHAHWRWVLFDMQRLLVIGAVHLLASGNRRARLGWLLRGLLDGLRGSAGPAPGPRRFGQAGTLST